MPTSLGVLFNIYTGGGGPVGTTVQVNGANPADTAYDASAPVNFASGNPITADDVVYSFNRVIAINKSPAFLFTSVGGLITDSVKAVRGDA